MISKKKNSFFLTHNLSLNAFAILGVEKIKPIEYALNNLIMASDMSRNVGYIMLGTLKFIYIFDNLSMD